MSEIEYPDEKAAIIAVMIDSLTQVRRALSRLSCAMALKGDF
jgi:hypothetical protein